MRQEVTATSSVSTSTLSPRTSPRSNSPNKRRRLDASTPGNRTLTPSLSLSPAARYPVLHLDSRHRVRATETVSIGTLNSAIVHPREVFKAAILANSHAIICAHNHPSGDLGPSNDDIELHRRLERAGHLLGIEVLDFLVISDTDYRSLK